MTLYEFLSLTDELQFQCTWDLGVPVDTILYKKIHYQLYAIGDFYVEIQYSATANKIIGKLAFKSGEALDKYLVKWPLRDM